MKKHLIFLLPALFSLSACGASDENQGNGYVLDLVCATPTGAPAMAFYKYLNSPEEKLDINDSGANVIGYLAEGSGKDIVVAPTNGGLMAILNKNVPYKIAATLTFGNFYLASTGKDTNGTLDPEDYVVGFQEANVPGRVFKYAYSSLGLSNVHWVDEATDAAKCLITGKNEKDDQHDVSYVLVAEPALTRALAKNAAASVVESVSQRFKSVSGGKEITQASIFVSNSADKAKVNLFLANINRDVTEFTANPYVLAPYIKDMFPQLIESKLKANAAELVEMTLNGNRMGLGYKNALENKESIENFMSLWGISSIDEAVFYQ